MQVARAFWDLDDANNEAAASPATSADGTNLATLSISAGWANFPDGTANNQDFETNTDGHAVNVKDYDANFNVDNATLLDHNCIGSQTSS